MTSQIHDLTLKAVPVNTDEIELQETAGGTSKRTTLSALFSSLSSGPNTVILGSGGVATLDEALAARSAFGTKTLLTTFTGSGAFTTASGTVSVRQILDVNWTGTGSPDVLLPYAGKRVCVTISGGTFPADMTPVMGTVDAAGYSITLDAPLSEDVTTYTVSVYTPIWGIIYLPPGTRIVETRALYTGGIPGTAVPYVVDPFTLLLTAGYNTATIEFTQPGHVFTPSNEFHIYGVGLTQTAKNPPSGFSNGLSRLVTFPTSTSVAGTQVVCMYNYTFSDMEVNAGRVDGFITPAGFGLMGRAVFNNVHARGYYDVFKLSAGREIVFNGGSVTVVADMATEALARCLAFGGGWDTAQPYPELSISVDGTILFADSLFPAAGVHGINIGEHLPTNTKVHLNPSRVTSQSRFPGLSENTYGISVANLATGGCPIYVGGNCLFDVSTLGTATPKIFDSANSLYPIRVSDFKIAAGFTGTVMGTNASTNSNTKSGGSTGAIASGATVAHGLAAAPTKVSVISKDITALVVGVTVDATNLTITFTGAGTHDFWWKAEL